MSYEQGEWLGEIASKNSCTLKTLYLGGHFSNSHVCKMVTTLPHSTTLERSSARADLNDATVCRIAEHCPKLQYLAHLNHPAITDRAIMKLAAHCPDMRSVHLAGIFQDADVSENALTALAQCGRSKLRVEVPQGLSQEAKDRILAVGRSVRKHFTVE